MSDRPTEALTSAQIGVVLGLEIILKYAGLILTCPRCALDGHPQLSTDNDPMDETWKIDCPCRLRRIQRSDVGQPMAASADLLLMAADVLGPVSLAVRCPSRQCIHAPLQMRQTREGLLVTCQCGGRFQFRKTQPMTTH